ERQETIEFGASDLLPKEWNQLYGQAAFAVGNASLTDENDIRIQTLLKRAKAFRGSQQLGDIMRLIALLRSGKGDFAGAESAAVEATTCGDPMIELKAWSIVAIVREVQGDKAGAQKAIQSGEAITKRNFKPMIDQGFFNLDTHKSNVDL